MSRIEDLWLEQDFEREYLSDYIFRMERELEASYEEWEMREKETKPIKITVKHEIFRKRKPFLRTYKKILQLRPHISSKTSGRRIRSFRYAKRKHQVRSFVFQPY